MVSWTGMELSVHGGGQCGAGEGQSWWIGARPPREGRRQDGLGVAEAYCTGWMGGHPVSGQSSQLTAASPSSAMEAPS